jgi:hypothetical protein
MGSYHYFKPQFSFCKTEKSIQQGIIPLGSDRSWNTRMNIVRVEGKIFIQKYSDRSLGRRDIPLF